MTKIIQRHDTAANWTSVNPTLSQGEFGVEDDTGKFKIGDGQTAWNSLAYASSGGGGGSGTPENMVTTDTEQTITGTKTFINDMFLPGIIVQNSSGDSVAQIAPGVIGGVTRLHLNGTAYLTASSTGVTLGDTSLQQVVLRGEKVQCYDPNGNKDILHTGNAFKQVKLTQAEYNALETKDENTVYIITDAASSPVPADYVIEVSDPSLMPSWYRVWNSGWCEQGGRLTSKGTQTLLKNYADTNYGVHLTYNGGSNWGNPPYINNVTTSSFNFNTSSSGISSSAYVNWSAAGRT